MVTGTSTDVAPIRVTRPRARLYRRRFCEAIGCNRPATAGCYCTPCAQALTVGRTW